MRPFRFRIILSVATTLAWLGWSGAAVTAGATDSHQRADSDASAGEAECMSPGTCEAAGGVCDLPATCGRSGPCWSFTAEAIALQRTNTRSQLLFDPNVPVFAKETAAGATDPLDARDLNFPVGFGYQLKAIRHDPSGCACDWEVGYFQVDGFTAQAGVPGLSYMIADANGLGFLVNDAEARYTSALYCGELNWRRQWWECVSLLAGFRMAQLNEHYRGAGTDFLAAPVITITDSVATNTSNHLYGVQLGADLAVYDKGGPLQINALCKAGVFDNAAHQDWREIRPGAVDESFGACRDQTAFLGEAGVTASYALTKRLTFRASAQAIWLTGVALAPEQIGSIDLQTRRDRIDTSGAVFYYGGGLGLVYQF
jgi:hypothetical protein